MDCFAERRQRLLALIQEEGVEAVLVTHPINVTYLTGFSGEASYLVVTPTKTILVSDGRFTQQLAEECPGLETVIRPPAQTVVEATTAVLNKLMLSNVGFESAHLTVAEFQTLADLAKTIQFKPGKDRVERLRQCKDDGEIAQIRQAIRIAERAFTMFRAAVRPQDTEKDLVDALENYVRLAGGKATAFPTIVAVGSRGALPHAPPTQRRVVESPAVLVDWGANGAFYKSDLTRVLLARNNSRFSDTTWGPEDWAKLEEVYAAVLQAQQAAIDKIRPGVAVKDVDAAARITLTNAGLGEYFNHSIGHGVGLQIHEAPFMKAGNEALVQAGMVVTVEPGVYLPGRFGVRIEDDVLVTPDGCELLTRLPRDLADNLLED
jgi:Xaa-Pro aminopeptidase